MVITHLVDAETGGVWVIVGSGGGYEWMGGGVGVKDLL